MNLELRDRTAVVTGCSVGIGREIARALSLALTTRAWLDVCELFLLYGGKWRRVPRVSPTTAEGTSEPT